MDFSVFWGLIFLLVWHAADKPWEYIAYACWLTRAWSTSLVQLPLTFWIVQIQSKSKTSHPKLMIIDLSHAKSSIRYCCKSKVDIYVYLSNLGLMVGSRALITGTQQTQGGKPVDHPATVLSPRFIAVASPQAPPAGSLAQGVWLPADSRLTPVVVVDQGYGASVYDTCRQFVCQFIFYLY